MEFIVLDLYWRLSLFQLRVKKEFDTDAAGAINSRNYAATSFSPGFFFWHVMWRSGIISRIFTSWRSSGKMIARLFIMTLEQLPLQPNEQRSDVLIPKCGQTYADIFKIIFLSLHKLLSKVWFVVRKTLFTMMIAISLKINKIFFIYSNSFFLNFKFSFFFNLSTNVIST